MIAHITGAVFTATLLAGNSSALMASPGLSHVVSAVSGFRDIIHQFHLMVETSLGFPLPKTAELVWPALLLWVVLVVIYLEFAPSPVKLIHNVETVVIPEWDAKTSRLKKTPLASLIKERCPELARGIFYPTFWLFNGDLQTIWAAIIARGAKQRVEYTRELLSMPDGGEVALDFSPKFTSVDEGKPLMVILHGLSGGSHETYVQDLVLEANAKGINSVVFNNRGCANTELKTPQLYSGSWTADSRFVLGYLKRKYPKTPLIAVGFSLGANILTKNVGEDGVNSPLIGFVSVANPYDLHACNLFLHNTWFGREIYSRAMTSGLKDIFKRHQDVLKDHPALTVDDILNSKLLPDFDDAVTRRVFGFRTVHEYYRMGSSAQYIPDIQIPGLLFSATDDPIAHGAIVPYRDVKENPNLVLATTKSGGHIGWFTGTFSPKRWYQKPVIEFVKALLDVHVTIPYESREEIVDSCRPKISPHVHHHYSVPGRKPINLASDLPHIVLRKLHEGIESSSESLVTTSETVHEPTNDVDVSACAIEAEEANEKPARASRIIDTVEASTQVVPTQAQVAPLTSSRATQTTKKNGHSDELAKSPATPDVFFSAEQKQLLVESLSSSLTLQLGSLLIGLSIGYILGGGRRRR